VAVDGALVGQEDAGGKYSRFGSLPLDRERYMDSTARLRRLRPAIEEQSDQVDVPRAHSRHQERVSRAVRRVDVRTGVQQTRRDGRIALFGSDVDRRDAEGVRSADVCTRFDQLVDSRQVVGPDAVVQRGRSIRIGCIDINALAQQQTDCRDVATRARLNEPLIRSPPDLARPGDPLPQTQPGFATCSLLHL